MCLHELLSWRELSGCFLMLLATLLSEIGSVQHSPAGGGADVSVLDVTSGATTASGLRLEMSPMQMLRHLALGSRSRDSDNSDNESLVGSTMGDVVDKEEENDDEERKDRTERRASLRLNENFKKL